MLHSTDRAAGNGSQRIRVRKGRSSDHLLEHYYRTEQAENSLTRAENVLLSVSECPSWCRNQHPQENSFLEKLEKSFLAPRQNRAAGSPAPALPMKRSKAPSVVGEAKKQKTEAENAALAAKIADEIEVEGPRRVLRHREAREEQSRPTRPQRDFVDITGKQPKKRGKPKKDVEEEEEPALDDDDEEEAVPVSEEQPRGEESNSTTANKENLDEPMDGAAERPRRPSGPEAAYFQVVYYQMNPREREWESHEGAPLCSGRFTPLAHLVRRYTTGLWAQGGPYQLQERQRGDQQR